MHPGAKDWERVASIGGSKPRVQKPEEKGFKKQQELYQKDFSSSLLPCFPSPVSLRSCRLDILRSPSERTEDPRFPPDTPSACKDTADEDLSVQNR